MLRRTISVLLLVLVLASGSPAPAANPDVINAVVGDTSWRLSHRGTPPDTADEVERIRTHLEFVIGLLEQADTRHLNPAQRARRSASLQHLRTYAAAGVFPRRAPNDGFTHRRPQFIDARGVHCAVGELIRHSGRADLALQIDAKWEFDYVPDMQSPALAAWADEHGFTARELAMIQPTYRPQTTSETLAQDVKRGTDGATLHCAKLGHKIPDELRITVAGDAEGNVTVTPASEKTPFATCFAETMQQGMQGMRKVAADPFSETMKIEPPHPVKLAEQSLASRPMESCQRLTLPTPVSAKLRAKAGDGKFEAFAETTPRNEKAEACLRREISSALHNFRGGQWTFDISRDLTFEQRVREEWVRMSVQTAATLYTQNCEGHPDTFTLKVSVKKGATKVRVTTADGDAKFQKCIQKQVGDFATKNQLTTLVDRKPLPSDADVEMTYTHTVHQR